MKITHEMRSQFKMPYNRERPHQIHVLGFVEENNRKYCVFKMYSWGRWETHTRQIIKLEDKFYIRFLNELHEVNPVI